jgi:hypothetical protein
MKAMNPDRNVTIAKVSAHDEDNDDDDDYDSDSQQQIAGFGTNALSATV